MEGLPKVPMFSIPRKCSPVAPDISPIKKKVKKRYQNQMHIDENMFRKFVALRTECCKLPNDDSILLHIRRYYAQLLLLKNRIDLSSPKFVEWPWQDAFQQKQFTRPEIEYEEASILYCLGAAYCFLGQKEARTDVNSMKVACTHFQYAASTFQSLRERYGGFTDAPDMNSDLFHLYSLITLSQAQECIVEKSIADGRPPNITAKLAKNLAETYERCLSVANALPNSVPSRLLKDWRRMLSMKKFIYAALVDYFMGTSHAAELQFGIAVAHFRLAQTGIEAAWRIAKEFGDATESLLGQSMVATTQYAREVIISCCAGAVKDNNEIYHELVPQLSELEPIKGTCLAKPFALDYTDPSVIGDDIFKDLLPIETLSANSLYSEMKANFLRNIMTEVEEKDSELGSFLSSLNLDPRELLKPNRGLPQPLLDVCAQLSGMDRSPESVLSSEMSALADVSVDVESEVTDLDYDLKTATDRLNRLKPMAPPTKVTQLSDQLTRLIERHAKFAGATKEAKQSNSQLHGALSEHLAAVRTLLLPVDQIDDSLPNTNDLIEDQDLLSGLDEVARVLAKVEQMRDQRIVMLDKLRDALQADDATQELLTTSADQHSELFERRLAAHDEAVKLIRMNLAAQVNITKALVETHAKIGVKKHDILERRRKREEEIDSLVRSGETFGDLLLKCGEGQSFYHDMSNRLHGLRDDLAQVNAALDDLEPSQHQQPPPPTAATASFIPPAIPGGATGVPPQHPYATTPPPTAFPMTGGVGAPGFMTLRDVLRARKAAETVGAPSGASPSTNSTPPPHPSPHPHTQVTGHPTATGDRFPAASGLTTVPTVVSGQPSTTIHPTVPTPAAAQDVRAPPPPPQHPTPTQTFTSMMLVSVAWKSNAAPTFATTSGLVEPALSEHGMSPGLLKQKQVMRLPSYPASFSPGQKPQLCSPGYPAWIPSNPAHEQPHWVPQLPSHSVAQPVPPTPTTTTIAQTSPQLQHSTPTGLTPQPTLPPAPGADPAQAPTVRPQPYYPSPGLFGVRYPPLSTTTPPPGTAHVSPAPPPQQPGQTPYTYQPSLRAQQYVTGWPQTTPQATGGSSPTPPPPSTSQHPGHQHYQPAQPVTGYRPQNLSVSPFRPPQQSGYQQYPTSQPQRVGGQAPGSTPADPMLPAQQPGYHQYQAPAPAQQPQASGQRPANPPTGPIQQSGYQQYPTPQQLACQAPGPVQPAQHPYNQPYSTPQQGAAQRTGQASTSAGQLQQHLGYQQYPRPPPSQQPQQVGGQQPGSALVGPLQQPGYHLYSAPPPQQDIGQPGYQTYSPNQQPGYPQYGLRPVYQYPQQQTWHYQYPPAGGPGPQSQPPQQYPGAPPYQPPGSQPSTVTTVPQPLVTVHQTPSTVESTAPLEPKRTTGDVVSPQPMVSPQPARTIDSKPEVEPNAGIVPAPGSLLQPQRVQTPLKEQESGGLDAFGNNAATTLPSTPITPTVLTQADLEVQRREKQLRATYDNAPGDAAQPASAASSTSGAAPAIDSREVPKTAPLTTPHNDPLSDPLMINRFIDSTERLLTWLETMNNPLPTTSSSNPSRVHTSRLDQSWLRVNEIASSGSDKRPTQAVARCSAAKNRSQDNLPYDFNRVIIKSRDDYINATNLDFISSLGEWCPRFILTQAPLPNTVVDFWTMIFDQACELVVLLLPPRNRTTLLPSSLEPVENYAEGAYGDPADRRRVPPHLPSLRIGSRLQLSGGSPLELRLQAVKLTRPNVSQQSPSVDSLSQSTCIERIFTLTNRSTQQTRSIVHLCYSGEFPNSGASTSIMSFTAFTQTAVSFYKQQRSLMHPVAVVSECGGGLGGMFIASAVALLHAEVLGRVADVCDIVGRICQQRKAAVEQPDQLAAICAVVGTAAKQTLARRDIVVGPSELHRTPEPPASTVTSQAQSPRTPAQKTSQNGDDDFMTNLFTSKNVQLSDMMSALGFAPNEEKKKLEESKLGSPTQPSLQIGSLNNPPQMSESGMFSDLPAHLVNLSLKEGTVADGLAVGPTNNNGGSGRHYQARDFTDSTFRASRDALAASGNGNSLFADLDPLNSNKKT